eukprot:RCo054636
MQGTSRRILLLLSGAILLFLALRTFAFGFFFLFTVLLLLVVVVVRTPAYLSPSAFLLPAGRRCIRGTDNKRRSEALRLQPAREIFVFLFVPPFFLLVAPCACHFSSDPNKIAPPLPACVGSFAYAFSSSPSFFFGIGRFLLVSVL